MLVSFVAGFFVAFAICAYLAYAYYTHAKRRVKSIQRYVADHKMASETVAEACDRAFHKR